MECPNHKMQKIPKINGKIIKMCFVCGLTVDYNPILDLPEHIIQDMFKYLFKSAWKNKQMEIKQ